MRRPFLLILVLLALYCWFKDFANFLFYVFGSKSLHTGIYSSFIGLFLFLGLLYAIKVTVFKNGPTIPVKEFFQTDRKKEWLLLLFVSLPVIALSLIRAVFPDQNYDTVHYELYLQEFDYIENKRNFAPGGTATYIFHLSEIFSGLFRHWLGYRLGSLFNAFLSVAIIASSYDFIKKFFSVWAPAHKVNLVLMALLASFVVYADNALLVLGSYKTDLIGIPLLIELLYMVFFGGRYSTKLNYLVFFILSSLIVALKLTYLPHVAILCFIFFIQNFKRISPAVLFSVPFVIFFFSAPTLLYSLLETGNPLFPFYNTFFHSPYYPNSTFKDVRFGPRGVFETLFYHFTMLADSPRRNEWSMYGYRLLFGWLTGVGFIVFFLLRYKKSRTETFLWQMGLLCIVALLCDYAWAVTTGITRYASVNEVFYGLIIALLLLRVNQRIASVFLVFAIFVQLLLTTQNVAKYNMSWYNYASVFENKELRADNLHRLLNDYGEITDNGRVLQKADAFVTIPPYPDGFARLLNKDIPIYDLTTDRTRDSVDNLERTVIRPMSQEKNLMVVAHMDSWGYEFISSMNKRGYLATDMYEVYPDFMRANEPVCLFRIAYFDTARYTINTVQKFVTVGDNSSPDSVFRYHSDHKVKAFIREAPYIFDWPLDVYDLTINDRKYTINSKSKDNKIFALDTNTITLKASHSKACLVIIQEMEEKANGSPAGIAGGSGAIAGALNSSRIAIDLQSLPHLKTTGIYAPEISNGIAWTNGNASIELPTPIGGKDNLTVVLNTYMGGAAGNIVPRLALSDTTGKVYQPVRTERKLDVFSYHFAPGKRTYIKKVTITSPTIDSGPDKRVLSFPMKGLVIE